MPDTAMPDTALLQSSSPAKKRRLQPVVTYSSQEECNLEDFKGLVSQEVDKSTLKFASAVDHKIVVYDCTGLEATLALETGRKNLMAEWSWVLRHGPGCMVFKSAYQDLSTIDAASRAFDEIISSQRKKGSGGDHFAKAGANDRIWNSLEKLCVHSPAAFADYFANPWIAAISEAWLGPGYQVSAQVNVIKPGGKAQDPHRDYHLGFQSMETVAKFPLHVQTCLSPMLTLQGAVAHVDIPIESGPTKLLPFSHQYPEGYMAWKRDDFRRYFEDNFVQLPLKKGDMLFFNPALFHAGGDNTTSGATSVNRMVNLLQVSSPFGRMMESVNRVRMCKALYPILLSIRQKGKVDERSEDCSIAACAEGYQFPTNLDIDVPYGSVAPDSQGQLFKKALLDQASPEVFNKMIDEQASRWQSTV